MLDKKSIAKKLKDARMNSGMTLAELSAGILSVTALKNLENGTTSILNKNIPALCRKLGISPVSLIQENGYLQEDTGLRELNDGIAGNGDSNDPENPPDSGFHEKNGGSISKPGEIYHHVENLKKEKDEIISTLNRKMEDMERNQNALLDLISNKDEAISYLKSKISELEHRLENMKPDI